MRILIRALPIFLLMGLCTVSLAQSNNSSGTSNPSVEEIDATQLPQNNGNGTTPGTSIATAVGQQPNGQGTNGGSSSTPLTQQQIDNINESIALLQSQLQQINDPKDPRAVKLQATIDKYLEILNQ